MARRNPKTDYSSPTWNEQDDRGSRSGRGSRSARPGAGERHSHRTAKVVEIVGSSRASFEDAIECALEDARATTRGISGCEVVKMSIKCNDGEPLEYHVDLKIVFGVERTPPA